MRTFVGRGFSLVVAATLIPAACSRSVPPADAKKTAPATVAHPQTEAGLSTITLTPDAIARLGIETAAAADEKVSETRTVGGEIVVPEGRSVVVTAPVAGTLVAAQARPGARVARGQAIFRLVPLASGERDQRIEAGRAVTAAEAEDRAAGQRLERLESLLKNGAASQRSVEEARAQRQVAAATLDAARDRLKVVSRNPIGAQGEIAITAPFAGVLQTISAAQGQTVAASAPLFEVSQVDTLWVRVPVFAGDLERIDRAQPALVARLGATTAPRPARPVSAPLQGDPGAASVDLFFELSAAGAAFRPGERVNVQLPLAASATGLVIPVSAVVYDIHGSSWVYEDLGKGAYVRRRVEIARFVGNRAVVSRGIAAGTKVVTVGAAELFGTEFGAGK